MKNITKALTILTALIVVTSCDFEKATELQDSFEIKVAAEPVLSKVNLRVFNADGGKAIPSEIKVELEGENADKILTANGSKSFKVENGFITLGVNQNFLVSDNNTLNITANISADGFISKSREINFDGTDISEVQIGLLEKANLPKQIQIETINESLSNNETTNEINVSITSNTNSEEITEFTIPENTSFFDENDNLITGSNLQADFQTFETEAPDENEVIAPDENPEVLTGGFNEFPGGLTLDGEVANKFISKKSRRLEQSYLIPITNLWCFYLFVNGRRVSWFSNPTLVRNYIFRNAINPETNQPVKVGDVVSVFYYDRFTREREKLSNATVQSDRRGFYVEFTAPRSGVYPIGFERSFNHTCTTVNSIKFVNTGRRSFYLYTVANKFNPNRPIRYGYMYFNGETEINNNNINYWRNRGFSFLGEDMVLKIYNYSAQQRRLKVVYDEEVSVCELDGQTIDISNDDCFEERDLDVSLSCPDATYLLNNLYVYFREENQRNWGYFDRIRNSKLTGKSPCLEAGKKYQFGFWYGGWKTTPPLTEAQMVNLYENFDLPTICKAVKDL